MGQLWGSCGALWGAMGQLWGAVGQLWGCLQAFRQLSHRFHGKGSGKMKTERRMKKLDEEAVSGRGAHCGAQPHTCGSAGPPMGLGGPMVGLGVPMWV